MNEYYGKRGTSKRTEFEIKAKAFLYAFYAFVGVYLSEY
jgi:hypothetical protein